MSRKFLILVAILLCGAVREDFSCWAQEVLNQSEPEGHEPTESPEADDGAYLLGDLGRTALAEEGFTLGLATFNDFWGNVRGGNYGGFGILGNLNITLGIDTEKAGWWSGGTFSFWGIGVYGRRPAFAVGDFQFTSSLDAPDNFEPYEAAYAHSFDEDRYNIRFGIQDYSLEFATLKYGWLFVNSSFWTPPTVTQVPASFHPNTGLGLRFRVRPTERTYAMVGLYDGSPTKLGRLRRIDLEVGKRDGAYWIGELGWEETDPEKLRTKVSVGAWYNSATYVDPSGNERDSNFGQYLQAEQQLISEEDDPAQGLGVFVQGALADQDRNLVSAYVAGGLAYTGLIPCRNEDSLLLGFNLAGSSAANRRATPEAKQSERVIELGYRARITPYLTLQPDVQYVMDPAWRGDIKDDLILYLRTELTL